jgi:tellurite resistance protein TerC
MESIGTPAAWIGFAVFVVVMLALDLGVFHRKAHVITTREALAWTGVWVSLAMIFAAGMFVLAGPQPALEFLTGYVIEEALSVDNIFVFIVIFSAFRVPPAFQHRVLFWGVLGALVLRFVFIVAGAALLERFHFLFYVFGAFLAFTGVKLLLQRDEEVDPQKNVLLRLFRRLVPTVSDYRGQAFIVVENGKRYATPLLAVLVAIEGTDVVFAADSIPAIFAVTTDPFIVFTSNMFAIFGLRSLYFALAGIMDLFRYLKIGLALVLIFIGAKMLLSGVFHVPILVSLGVIVLLLGGSVVASLLHRRHTAATTAPVPEAPVDR